MKKTLVVMGVLGAISSFAFAESNVTLYGRVDAGAVVQNPKTSGTGMTFDAKSKGAKPWADYSWDTPTTVAMKSGWRTGSRWGIKGTEDLGNGNSVGFVLEQGFNVDDGSSPGGFNREASLSLAGGWGTAYVGRFGSLSSGVGPFAGYVYGWALGASYTQGAWEAYTGTLRVNNAIGYMSPSFGGLQLALIYSNGISADENKWSDNQHYYGIGAKYTGGALTSILTFEVQDNKDLKNAWIFGYKGTPYNADDEDSGYTRKDPTEKAKALYTVNFGIGYQIGVFTPMFAYQFQNQNDFFQAHTFGLGVQANVGGGTAMLGTRYRLMKLKGATKAAWEDEGSKGNVWTINAAYEYPLSKRTVLWGYGGWSIGNKLYKGENLATLQGLGLNAPGADKAMSADQAINYNGWAVGLGMTHYF